MSSASKRLVTQGIRSNDYDPKTPREERMPRKKTHDEFVRELAGISPSITVVGEYVNASTRIKVRCKDCGHEWTPVPSSLVNTKSGCPRCARTKTAMRQQKTNEQFLEELDRLGIDYVEVLEIYSGVDTKLLVRCKRCGNEWRIAPGHLKRGRGCPKCSGHHKRSHDEFISEVAISNPDVEVLGVFSTLKDPIEAKCLKCGMTWFPSAKSLLRGAGCPVCASNRPISHGEFVERLKCVNPAIEILGQYRGSKEKIEAKCLACGTVWFPLPGNLLRGSSCPKCSYEKRAAKRAYDTSSFSKKLKEVNSRIKVVGDYVRSGEKIRVLCLDCQNEWEATPASLLSGHGCPNCIARSTSFMEQYLLYALRMALGEQAVRSRDKATIGKELDIVLPDHDIALEPGSWFWHKTKIEADAEKRDLCRAAGIRLITIYDCFEKSVPPFGEDCLVYPFDLRSEKGHKTLKRIVRDVLCSIGEGHLYDRVRWEEVDRLAERGARMMTAEEFVSAVESIRPDVEVVTEFTSTKASILARCKVCGYEWKATAGSLLRGSGCRKCGRKICANKLRMSHEEYKAKLASINGDIEVIGVYKSSNEPIRVRCRECGYEWEPVAISLTSGGRGCPRCWEGRRGKTLIKTYEHFIRELKAKGNPNIQLVGTYSKLSDRLEVKCGVCGYEWSPRAGELLKGHGCPRCAGHQKMTHDQFVARAKAKNSDIEILSEYQGANSRIDVLCKKCGCVWQPKAIALTKSNPNGCPKCARERRVTSQKRTTEQFVKELALIDPSIEVLGEYINANTKIRVRCKICGHEWEPKPSYLLNMKRGCPTCK